MIKQVWAWLTGYITIKFKGVDLEVLLNRIADQGFGLWDVERVTADIIIGKIPIRRFKKIRPLLQGLNVRISIIGKSGLPFLISRMLQRKALIIGLVVFMLVLYYLSGFIWFIEIHGCEQITREDIITEIANEGLKIGTAKSDFNAAEIENSLLVKFPQFSWVGVNSKGVLLTIQVVERTSPLVQELQYGDLVAERGGLITQILPYRGTVKVHVGDTVKKGDVLISGKYYDMYGKLQHGRAEGIVRARVWYDAIGEAGFSKVTQVKTENTHVNYTITLGNSSFNWGKPVPFELYTVDSKLWQRHVKGYKLPLTVTMHTYSQVYYEIMSIPRELAKTLALERAWQQLEEAGIQREKILDSHVKEYVIEDQNGLRIGLIIEIEENIACFEADF
ncbi:MAG: sporulation protein YqfD [Firmicutes bacterium]|nr:sporulation protein YqfD [Bacillota bacterium]